MTRQVTACNPTISHWTNTTHYPETPPDPASLHRYQARLETVFVSSAAVWSTSTVRYLKQRKISLRGEQVTGGGQGDWPLVQLAETLPKDVKSLFGRESISSPLSCPQPLLLHSSPSPAISCGSSRSQPFQSTEQGVALRSDSGNPQPPPDVPHCHGFHSLLGQDLPLPSPSLWRCHSSPAGCQSLNQLVCCCTCFTPVSENYTLYFRKAEEFPLN